MSKRLRQIIGVFAAIVAYYLIHEGAHFLYAVCAGVFRRINFMGLGVQVDVYAENMTDAQLGIFCLVGAAATFFAGVFMTLSAKKICRAGSKLFRATAYYITIAFLLLDPIYLSILCGFFGGGDMNGISLLFPEWAARVISGVLLLVNGFIFIKLIWPVYTRSFAERQ